MALVDRPEHADSTEEQLLQKKHGPNPPSCSERGHLVEELKINIQYFTELMPCRSYATPGSQGELRAHTHTQKHRP